MSLDRIEAKIDRALVELGEVRSTTNHIYTEQQRIRNNAAALSNRVDALEGRVNGITYMFRGAALIFAFIGAAISTFFNQIWTALKGVVV